ncbi:helix-turn-helix transcriptional regulator [Vibrio makurazakiensis]|uniref:AraC family transcriptional regulator n=1 Tax=Vibrio makurazakiensis TaxID=2910250 RepID=UPI003D0E4A03
MALIDESTPFDVDILNASVIGVAARVGKHDSGMHQHIKAQLLYAPQGCMTVMLDEVKCVLPPTRAMWIPSGTNHCITMTNVVEYRSLHFDVEVTRNVEPRMRIVEVNPLLQALIERMAFWPWDKNESETVNTTALFLEEFEHAPEYHLALPYPTDRRLTAWVKQLSQQTTNAPSLHRLSEQVGASSKTISRIFTKETGMSYQAWRQQWRLLKAIELLSSSYQVNDVAYQLEFSSDSAFIAFFKQQTGKTPLQFLHSP